MRKLILTTVLVFAFSKADAQSFVRTLTVIEDSVPIRLLGYTDSGNIYPLNKKCLCLKTPEIEYEGKVLIEFLGSTNSNMGVFYGYSKMGNITSCFAMEQLSLADGRMLYNQTEMSYVVVMEPNDKLFR